jgi:hypothetical protein
MPLPQAPQNRCVRAHSATCAAAPRVAGRRQGVVVDPAGLAVALIQQADRLQLLRCERQLRHERRLGQGQVALAHQQAAGMEQERQRGVVLLRRDEGRERGRRLEHGGIR